ncbi:MAG: hypothetical protein DMF64_16785 [Acidobacteria bacterium]|nr:MAG: hypothetical protein DMF64_16785 [Acidobacteriota bacterium]
MEEETAQAPHERARETEASATDAAQSESSGLQAERESAAAMNADVPQPPDESHSTDEKNCPT